MKKKYWFLIFLIVFLGGGWISYKEITEPKNIFEEIYKVEVHDFTKNRNEGLIHSGFKRHGNLEQFGAIEGRTFFLNKKYNRADSIEYRFHTFDDDKYVAIIYKRRLDSKETLNFEYDYSFKNRELTKESYFDASYSGFIDVHSKLARKLLSKYQLNTKDIGKECEDKFQTQVVDLWIKVYRNTKFSKDDIGKFKE